MRSKVGNAVVVGHMTSTDLHIPKKCIVRPGGT